MSEPAERSLAIVGAMLAAALAANLVAAFVFAFFTTTSAHGAVERLRLVTVNISPTTALIAVAAVVALAMDRHARPAARVAVTAMSALVLAVGVVRSIDIAFGNLNYAGQVTGHAGYRVASTLSELVVALLGGAATWWAVRTARGERR